MRKGPKTMRAAMVLLIMVITVMLLYYHMVNKVRSSNVPETITPVQEVLLVNLEKDYPATPREVMKFYNQILECYYNEEWTDQEFEDLAGKALALYDEELIALQNPDTYVEQIKGDVMRYKESKTVLSSAALAASTDVDFYSYQNRQCANIRCVYTMREKTNLSVIKEIYALRKDESGHWKILGWDVMEDEEEHEE